MNERIDSAGEDTKNQMLRGIEQRGGRGWRPVNECIFRARKKRIAGERMGAYSGITKARSGRGGSS